MRYDHLNKMSKVKADSKFIQFHKRKQGANKRGGGGGTCQIV